MSEHFPGIESKKTPLYTIGISEKILPPETKSVIDWANEQIKALPEMKVTRSPVTDGNSWKATHTPEGEVDKVSSNFFSFEGIDVATPDLTWHQGAIIQNADTLSTIDGKKIPVSGFVILITDQLGKTFVTMHQSPLMHAIHIDKNGSSHQTSTPDSKEVHPIARTPIQMSLEKMRKLQSDPKNSAYDKNLSIIFKYLETHRGKSINEILQNIPLVKGAPDGDRIQSDVVYGSIALSAQEAVALAKQIPEGRWCTPTELDALAVKGLLNGHMHEAMGIVKAIKKFK